MRASRSRRSASSRRDPVGWIASEACTSRRDFEVKATPIAQAVLRTACCSCGSASTCAVSSRCSACELPATEPSVAKADSSEEREAPGDSSTVCTGRPAAPSAAAASPPPDGGGLCSTRSLASAPPSGSAGWGSGVGLPSTMVAGSSSRCRSRKLMISWQYSGLPSLLRRRKAASSSGSVSTPSISSAMKARSASCEWGVNGV
eukprot:scaffold7021_cov120-Isochrysis_galbana.AAC.1